MGPAHGFKQCGDFVSLSLLPTCKSSKVPFLPVLTAMDACSLPFYTYKKIGAQGTADAIESFVLSLISVLRMTQGVVGLRACIA